MPQSEEDVAWSKNKKISHWMGPWITAEKLYDMLFTEEHEDTLYYPCAVSLCQISFILHGNLVTHLKKYHDIDTARAKRLSNRVEKVQRQDHCDISGTSEDKCFFDNFSPNHALHSNT